MLASPRASPWSLRQAPPWQFVREPRRESPEVSLRTQLQLSLTSYTGADEGVAAGATEAHTVETVGDGGDDGEAGDCAIIVGCSTTGRTVSAVPSGNAGAHCRTNVVTVP